MGRRHAHVRRRRDDPAITVRVRDLGSVMVNIDSEGGDLFAEVDEAMRWCQREQRGIYGRLMRIGRASLGHPVVLHPVRNATSSD